MRIILAILTLLILSGAVSAQTVNYNRFSNYVNGLPNAGTLNGSEQIYVLRNGISYQSTISNIASIINRGAAPNGLQGRYVAGDIVIAGSGGSVVDSNTATAGYVTLPVALNITAPVIMSGANGLGTSAFYWNQSVSGTCTGNGQPCYANNIFANGFAVTWSAGQFAGPVVGNLNVSTVFGGANQIGGFVNLNSVLNMTAATGNTSNAFYVSAQLFAQTSVNDGGTGGGANARGSLFATNPQTSCLTGATFYVECSGSETNIEIQNGASANLQYGEKVVLSASNAVAASVDSGGFLVGAEGGAVNTLACGYCFGQNGGGHGIASTGMLIGATGTGVSSVAYGLYFFNFPPFSNAMIVGPSAGAASIETGNGQIFSVIDGGNGGAFAVLNPASAITAALHVIPGTGASGAITLIQSGVGTGGIVLEAGANPVILGNSTGSLTLGGSGMISSSASNCGSLSTSTGCLKFTDSNGNVVYAPLYGTL